jgi:uncharacterized protein YukE
MTPPIKIDPAAVEAVGRELSAVCADLRSAHSALTGSAGGADPATGGEGAPAAYGQMWSAWDRDLTTLAAALCDLGQRTVAAAQAYGQTDQTGARHIAGSQRPR